MGKTSLQSFGDFRNVDLFYVLESGISEMKNIQREIVQIEFNDIDTHEMDMVFELKENNPETKGDRDEKTKIMLKEATEFLLDASRYLLQSAVEEKS